MNMLQGVEAIRWIAGSWNTLKDGHEVEEIWMEPKDGVVMGITRWRKESTTRREEYMRIGDYQGTMSLALQHGFGTPLDVYPAIEMSDHQALFGRPDDTRQIRIRYKPTDRGIFCSITGMRDGNPFKTEFDFEPDTTVAKKLMELRARTFGIHKGF